ncbi:Arginase, catabolizes arginine to ornithine and urea, partial [Quaeritorhiza haematococci]
MPHTPADWDVHPKFLNNPYTVGLVGAAFSGGQPRGGVEEGPIALIEHGLVDQLKDMGWDLDESEPKIPNFDSLKPRPSSAAPASNGAAAKLKNAKYVSRVCEAISQRVRKTCALKHVAVTLGGDHSVAMGTISGSAAVYKDLGVIWVDAHADINTPESTVTGNLHGCPVSFLTGLAGSVEGFEWLQPCLKTNRIVYIGLRDVDPPEKKILKQNKIKAFSMHDVDKHGIGKVMEMALDYLGRDKPIHLSFDVDAMDPSVVPATGTPVRGGLTFREGHYICEAIWETGSLVAMDLVEVNPALGSGESLTQTVQIGCSL